ncbi:kinase-like domain-containing protein [Cerioporus squamosus]|nr:kinase-like domain-containing protein [Cerioporus squamosus]
MAATLSAERKTTSPRSLARTADSGFVSATRSMGRWAKKRAPATPVASSSRHTLDRANPPNHRDMQTGIPISYAEKSTGRRPVADLHDLECISTLGTGSWGAAYLVKVKRRFGKPTGKTGALLALKSVEKRAYRDLERNDPREDRWEAAEAKNLERRALTSLPWNPFVAGVLDAYADPRNVYLLLELAPRGSISDLLADGPLSPEAAKFYFANLVLGLEFLHSHDLIHRDIKTDNILVGADGYAMITDFGFSQFVHDSKEWDRLGTVAFVSPEIATKTANTTEARFASDWWSAACALFEMLTTSIPFHPKGKGEYAELVEEHWQQNIHWPTDPFDEQAEDLIERMLTPQLSSRYGSRTIPVGRDGSEVNEDVREHAWMKDLRWDRLEARIERAPKWPDPVPMLTSGWDDRSLPTQKKVPGLRLKRRFPQCDAIGDSHPAGRPSKRQRTAAPTETTTT